MRNDPLLFRDRCAFCVTPHNKYTLRGRVNEHSKEREEPPDGSVSLHSKIYDVGRESSKS